MSSHKKVADILYNKYVRCTGIARQGSNRGAMVVISLFVVKAQRWSFVKSLHHQCPCQCCCSASKWNEFCYHILFGVVFSQDRRLWEKMIRNLAVWRNFHNLHLRQHFFIRETSFSLRVINVFDSQLSPNNPNHCNHANTTTLVTPRLSHLTCQYSLSCNWVHLHESKTTLGIFKSINKSNSSVWSRRAPKASPTPASSASDRTALIQHPLIHHKMEVPR